MLLSALDAPPTARLDARGVVAVLAHPDDETIGCGGLLSRLDGVSVVCLTDGAPRNDDFAKWAGFADSATYAARRRDELTAALGLAGLGPDRIVRLGLMDQEVGYALAGTARDLADLFRQTRASTVLTHAFEGGHPDHDAVAFGTQAAAALLGAEAPRVVEMPFYHLGDAGMVVQSFCDGEAGQVLTLTSDQQALKRRMMAAHGSQKEVLSGFGVAEERYRIAKNRDFRRLPNRGRLLYSTFVCSFNASDWSAEVSRALTALHLD